MAFSRLFILSGLFSVVPAVNAETLRRPTAAPPAYASPAEAKLRATLLERLKPLLAFKLSAEDRAASAEALSHIRKRRPEAAQTLERGIADSTARKLLEWQRLLRSRHAAGDYAAFLERNPLWPDRRRLQRLFEQALLRDGGSAKQIKSYFANAAPTTGAGVAALASAELALGNKETASKLAARAWCFGRISSRDEDDFVRRFRGVLKEADHKCRLDRLLISVPRARSIRRSRASAANRLLPLLSANESLKAKARIKVYQRRGGLKELRTIVKDKTLVNGDWGLAFQRIVRSRRSKNYEHAYKIMKAVPGETREHINRDAWWEERERHARYWLAKGNTKRAYEIVADARPTDDNQAKQQAFLAGRLALVHLKKPKAAIIHFKRMVTKADGPLSKSMSEYWLARAYAKLGNRKKARAGYNESAKIRDTFHGLLSKLTVEPRSRAITLPVAKLPSPEEVKRFLAIDAIKGLLIAHDLGLPRRDILAFYRTLGRNLKTEGELALLAQLASAIGDGQGEVRTGKAGISRGFNLYEFAYPVHLLPKYEPLRKPVEPAMLLAIARQESEFNTTIVSRAGARGVLQVMPITARHVCRQYKIKCKLGELLSAPSYNARIASAYIADRRDQFGGSYILTLTGFNAGPGRTRQWLRQMGDPRSGNIDPLQWIYQIPFEETRLYVRKVLSNVQIYRARLGEKNPLRLDEDLKKGRR
jgi:soluble lytic murein transglycosylase